MFAPTAQSEIVNYQAEPGAPPVLQLSRATGGGAFTFDSQTDTYTLDLGVVAQNSAQPIVVIDVVNAAAAPADSLGGAFTAPLGGGFLVAGDYLSNPIAAGAAYTGLQFTPQTTTTGVNAVTMSLNPTDVNASGFSAALPAVHLKVEETVANPAQATINTPSNVIFPNVHVGVAESQHVSVSNTAPAPATSLDVSVSANGQATSSGSISLLAPGATDATALSVGIDTSAAGARSGVVTLTAQSDNGAGNLSAIRPSPIVDVFGSVYRLASYTVNPGNLVVRLNASGSPSLTITNTDPADGYSENLVATVVGVTGAVAASGSTGDIAPSASGAIPVSFSTSAVGPVGSVTLDLQSDGTGVDGLGLTDLGQITVPISVTNANLPAAAAFEKTSGAGTLTQNGSVYTLALGNVTASTTVNLGVLNTAAAPADPLGGGFSISGDSAFANSGFTNFSGVAARQADGGLSVTLGNATGGAFSETITLNPIDLDGAANPSLPSETLTITGTVVNDPPSIVAPAAVTVQQDQSSAVAGVSIADSDAVSANETITAKLFDAGGLLSANTTAAGGGGTITGSDSNLMTIVGSLAQVNADLGTLTDFAASVASDTIVINASDGRGGVATPASIVVTVQPVQLLLTISPVNGNNIIDSAQAHDPGGVPLSGTLSGLAAGAHFQISVTDGAFAHLYQATVDGAGTGWSATIPEADAVTLAQGTATISAQFTDTFGNVSPQATASVTVAVTSPALSIYAVESDDVLNEAEASAPGGVPLTGGSTGLLQAAGFTITLTNGGASFSYAATVGANGAWTATIPTANAEALADGSAALTATATDANGHVSPVASHNFTVAEKPPSVTFGTVAGNDVLNAAEAAAAAGVALTGGSTGLAQGAAFIVKLTDSGASFSYTATVGANGAWTATIPTTDAQKLDDGTATLTATATDANGNVSPVASHNFTVAETPPSLTIGTVAGDDVLDEAEAAEAAGVALTGGSTGLASGATFTIKLTDNGASFSYTATVGANGAWTATIPTTDAQKLADGTATLSATATDANGNVSPVASHNFTVAEAPTLTIGTVAGNDVLNEAEASAPGGVPLTGGSTGLLQAAGFTITLTDGGASFSYTATVGANGAWTATIPTANAEALADGSAALTATATDANGHVSPVASHNFTVAEKPPSVTFGTVAGNDVLNAAEAAAAAGVALTGGSTGLAQGAAFMVKLTDSGASFSYTATVGANGVWTATIPTTDAQKLADGTATLSATATDANGNVSPVASHNFTVAETPPSLTIGKVESDDVVNEAEAAAGVALSGGSTGLVTGATFTVHIADGGASDDVEATVGDAGAWTATIAAAVAQKLADGTATLTATATDANGNVSPLANHNFTVAETPPTLTINAVEGNDTLTAAEAKSDVALTGASTGLATGATFTVSVAEGGQSHNYTATVADGGAWAATMPAADAASLAQGNATVSATATDAFGNMSAPVSRTFDVQTNGQAIGDVHLTTFRGQRYDFQATGEFILVASTLSAQPFEVQVQESGWRGMTAVTTEIAAKVGGAALVFKTDGSVSVNGVIDPAAKTPSYTLTLDGGQFTRLSANDYEIDWSGGERLSFQYDTNLGWFDVTALALGPNDGANSVQGLLGRNENFGSDFSMPDGTLLSPNLSNDELTGFYADAWRVTSNDTLFSGAPSAASVAPANAATASTAGLSAQRTPFNDGSFAIATTGIAGEPYNSSFAFYSPGGGIETELFARNGFAYQIENWNSDGSVRDSTLLGGAGAPLGASAAIDLEAFSSAAVLGFHEDASGAFGLLSVTEGAKALTLQLNGDFDASQFSLAGDPDGGARVTYRAS